MTPSREPLSKSDCHRGEVSLEVISHATSFPVASPLCSEGGLHVPSLAFLASRFLVPLWGSASSGLRKSLLPASTFAQAEIKLARVPPALLITG